MAPCERRCTLTVGRPGSPFFSCWRGCSEGTDRRVKKRAGKARSGSSCTRSWPGQCGRRQEAVGLTSLKAATSAPSLPNSGPNPRGFVAANCCCFHRLIRSNAAPVEESCSVGRGGRWRRGFLGPGAPFRCVVTATMQCSTRPLGLQPGDDLSPLRRSRCKLLARLRGWWLLRLHWAICCALHWSPG